MKCPKCIKENKKSTVVKYGDSSTLVGYMTYYDENGVVHHHDKNNIVTMYRCSNNHRFTATRKGTKCPSYPENCDFSGGEDIISILN